MKVKIDLVGEPLNCNEHQLYPEFLLEEKTNLKYFPMDIFRKRLNVSDKTIRRMISKLKNNSSERYFVKFHGKYYLSLNIREPFINGEDIRLSFKQYLKKYDWRLWGSINFSEGLTLNQTRKMAEQYFEAVKIKFPDESFTYFFASEANSSRDGYHFHFLLDFSNEKNFNKILYASTSFFVKKRKNLKVDALIERFDAEKDGINYVLKQIKMVPDGYDVFLC